MEMNGVLLKQEEFFFSNNQLKSMIVPLVLEQLLLMLVGMADIVIVSYTGETAVSGVSLVNSFNTIFIYLFTALASGGAVIVSQYIGRKNIEKASESISQLLMISTLFSIGTAGVLLIFNETLLKLLFGKVEPAVMEACITYLRISAYSYPALAVYNTGAALYRSIGKTAVTMNISIIANIINVVGNILGVFYFNAGVAGVAYPSLISRVFSALAVTYLCFKETEVRYFWNKIFQWNRDLLNTILKIAVPNGVESGIFQLVKVALSSVVALFGTYQIAANGIAQSIWSVAALINMSIGPVFITVIGQCMGAKNPEAAEYYLKKLIKITMIASIVWNFLVFILTPLLMRGYAVSPETKELVILLVLIHNGANAVIFPFVDPLGKGMRAAGDIRFTMTAALVSTVGVRLVFSYILGIVFNLGVIGIAYAMCLDWLTRAILFYLRFKRGSWKNYQVI